MKIALGSGPLLSTLYFANYGLRKKNLKISTIFICPFKLKSNNKKLGPLKSLLFLNKKIGMRFIGFNILDSILPHIITILNRLPFYPKDGLWSFSKLAKEYNINFVFIDSFNSDKFRKILKKEKFDLVFINGSDQILKKETLDIPRLGCFNFHTSFLPEYQGIDPIFQMMIKNEDYLAVTCHKMTPKVDRGPIYLRKKQNIPNHLTYFFRRLILMEMAGDTMDEYLKNLTIQPINIESKPLNTYRSWPNITEVKRFFLMGHKIFNWKEIILALKFKRLDTGL